MATSKREASQAGKDLRNSSTPKRDRGPIASDLAQAKRTASRPSKPSSSSGKSSSRSGKR